MCHPTARCPGASALLVLLASVLPAGAQAQGGAISGRVTDAAGAALADVTVTIRGAALLVPRTTSTTPAGGYRFEAIPAGIYEVTFERDGFHERGWDGFRIGDGVRAALDARLETDHSESGEQGMTGGIPTAVVTRAAASRFGGSAWGSLVDHRLQSTNLTPELAAQGAGFGNPVRRVTEVGVELGGPIRANRAWMAVSADRTDTNVGVIGFYTPACSNDDGTPAPGAAFQVRCLQADITRLEHVTARLQYQWTPAHRTTVAWGRSETRKPTRGSSAYDRLEHTNRQSDLGRAQPFQAEHHGVLPNGFLIDARYSYSDASFILDFQEPGLAAVQGAYDRFTLVNWRSAVQTEHRLPATHVSVAARRVSRRERPGRHETSIGLEVVDRSARRIDRTGGGAVAVFDSRSGLQRPYQARLVRDGETSHWERHWSLFLRESYGRGRLALDAGVRLDVQDDGARPATIPANPLLPDLLPAVRFPGADSDVVYKDVSPRVEAKWALDSDARTLLRAGVARSRAVGNTTSAPLQPTGPTRLVYWWDDADGDGLVRREELDLARGFAATPSPNYDPDRPWAVRTPAAVDPSLRNVATEELTVGVERQVTRHLSVRANYTSRWIHRVQGTYRVNDDGSAVSSDTFYPVSWGAVTCPAGAACPTVTFYERADPLPARTLLRNDGRYSRHQAVDFVLHKRRAQGWMLDVALSWSRARRFFPEPTRDYTDPTNVAMWNGTEYSMPGSRWTSTIRASTRLPLGLEAAAVVTARDGLPFARVVTSPNRQALGAVGVLTGRYGSERYPAVGILDCRLERKFAVGQLALTPSLGVFNAANAGTVLRRNATQNSQAANAVTRILPPRSARLELRASW